MKCVLSLLLILLSAGVFTLHAEIFDEYLEAYWSFDDSTATDNSGNGYHGIFKNEVYPVEGVDGNAAIWMQGHGMNSESGGHVLLSMIDFNNLKEFTITLWVKEHHMSYWHGGAYIFFGDATNGFLGIMNHFPIPDQDTTLFLKYVVGGEDWYNHFRHPFDYNDSSILSGQVFRACLTGKV